MSFARYYILDAASRSSIHGLPHFANLQSPFLLRVSWLVCLTLSSAICSFMMFTSISKYLQYGVITTVQKIGETPAPFPKVSICNSNFVTNQVSLDFATQEFNKNPQLKEDIIDQYESVEQFVALKVASGIFSTQEKEKFGNSLREMVISCEFGSTKCDMNEMFWFNFDTLAGRCYHFNSGLNMNSNATSVLYSSLTGKKNGLRLKLYVPHLSVFETFSSTYGVRVAIHNQSFAISAPKFNAFDVAVDTETNIRVSRDFTSRMPPPYNECVQGLSSFDSVFVKLFKDANTYYIRQFCFRLCFQRRLVEVCDCHDPAFVFYGRYTLGRRPCSTYQDFKCLNRNFEKFFRYEMNANCSKECPLECESYDYSTSVSTVSFPKNNYYYVMLSQSEHLAKTVLNMSSSRVANLTRNLEFDKLPSIDVITKTLKGKTLSLNVYYDDLEYSLVQESPEIYLIDLIANLGGLLGLWIGASFMSFLEFTDLAIQLVIGFIGSQYRAGFSVKNSLFRKALARFIRRKYTEQ